MEKTIFSVDPKRIGELKDKEGTELFRDLLWCDAVRLGLRNIVVSLDTNDPDGGIDAKADSQGSTDFPSISGSFHFQIKTGKSYKPWQESSVKKELFGSLTVAPSKVRLGQAVRDCMDSGGAYVLVTLGHDLSPANHTAAESLLRKNFQACGYKKADVNVWGQGQIVKMLELYPSLCLDLGDKGNAAIQTLRSWAANSDMTPPLELGEPQRKFEQELQGMMRGAEIQHARVIGEPGIGKTRLVLEALRSAGDLAARCVYVSQAGLFQSSKLFNELLKTDREYWILLVIDECDDTDRASIWGSLKGRERLKLITIDHGPENSTDDAMRTLQFPALEHAQIESIISDHVGHSRDISNWAVWCEGSARVAHAVGENLKRNPDDLLKEPATVPIWDRFILGYKKRDGAEADRLRVIMRHIALFQKFGFKKPVADEAKFVAAMAAKVDSSITTGRFSSDVLKYVAQRILQGSHTLRIVPKALHVHLWKEWWENYGQTAILASMMSDMPVALRKWFLNMFIYANGVDSAQQAVREVLSLENGPFADKGFLMSESGTRFLNTLAEADPAATIELLQKTVGQWPLADVDAWETGRQNVVFALQKIAVWSEHFRAAAQLLARMSLGEKSTNSNNARGTLRGLFDFRHGPTQAPPSSRLLLAKSMLLSTEQRGRELGIQLCGACMNLHGTTRIIGVEYQGLKPVIEFWQPKIWNDLFVPWREALKMLASENKSSDASWKLATSREIIQCADAMLSFNCLPDEALDRLVDLSRDIGNDMEKLIQTIIVRVRFSADVLPKKVYARLKKLEKQLESGSFLDRLNRFVVYNIYDDDYTYTEGGDVKESDLPAKRMAALARELLTTSGLLDEHLAFLLLSEGYRIGRFGRLFALEANDDRFDTKIFSLANTLGAKTRHGFIGGYLDGAREIDHARWEKLALQTLKDVRDGKWRVWAVTSSGFSAPIVEQLVLHYSLGAIESACLLAAAWPQGVKDVTNEEIGTILEALLSRPDESSRRVALEIANRRFCINETLGQDPEKLIWRVLTDRQFFESHLDTMVEYYWTTLAKRFIQRFPGKGQALLKVIITNSGRPLRLRSPNSISEVAIDIVKTDPKAAWKIIAKEMTKRPEGEWFFWHLLGDTGSSQTPLTPMVDYFSPGDVMQWIKGSADSRVHLAIGFAPKTLVAGRAGDLTRAIIDQYGSSDAVAGALIGHFDSGAYWGPRSDRLSERREEARAWLSANPSMAVQDWIERYIGYLTKNIEQARISEEREF